MKIRKLSAGFIIRGDEVLLVKRKYGEYKNTWCFPGGFTEKNETIEDCVIREVKEETNIDTEVIKHIDTLKFYNKNKDRNEEVHIFLCKPKSDEIIMDNEVLDCKWFNLNRLDKMQLTPGVRELILKHKNK